MRLIWRTASAFALAAGVSGCATITRGTTTQFTVDSTPPAAQARTSTGFTCEATPCSFKMPRKESFIITVSKTGYKPVETHVKSGLAGTGAAGFLGNALVGGVIGAGVDVSSGAMLDLTPNPLHVTLTPDEGPAPVAAVSAPAPAKVASVTPADTTVPPSSGVSK